MKSISLPRLSSCSIAVLMVLASSPSALAASKGFVLVQEGRPKATIVTAAKPSENAAAAARELQHYVRKMSGAELPILIDEQETTGPVILVGASRFTEKLPDLKIPSGLTPQLREEGFVVQCRGDRLVLAGNDAGPYFGTRYAVVELLHRLGVRWFMPGEFGEVIPQTRTVSISEMEVRQRPDFTMRNYWQHARDNMAKEDYEWKIHHKMNPKMQDWFGVPGDSSIRGYMPGKEVFKAHPDWFALKRDGARDQNMVCMTSTGMIGHFVARVKADAQAGKKFSAFAPDDGMPRCYCERCQKIANGFDGYGANDRDPLVEASISNEWFHFIDAVLDEVNKEFPEHKIATNGYANRDIPPEIPGFNRRHNLVVMFANICACTMHAYDDPHCWQMQRQGQMIQQWGRLCDKVWLYDYNYTMLVSKFTITPMVSRLRRNIPLLKEWGLIGFHDQDEADWALTGIPTRLVRAALEWDTKTEVDGFLSDFYTRWFGRAAVPMKSYYDALEAAFASSPVHGHEDVVLNSIYTPALLKKLEAPMQQAEKRAESDAEKLHVRLERGMFDYVRDYVAMEAAKRECEFASAAGIAEGLLKRQKELNQVSPFLGYEPYAVYAPDWEAKRMHGLAGKSAGPEGKLLALLPEAARGRTDPFDDGRYERWQDVNFDDSRWQRLLTTTGWDGQGFSDEHGHAYRGLMWYRQSVDIPAEAAGKSVWLFAPAVVNEAWVWVNGQYAGHRAHKMPWFRPQPVELEISSLMLPGKRNQITFRVLNNIDVFGASGIYERMFIYAREPGSRASGK
ncbi:MAG TPA: DUF4838 domain-containing protein [Verrucomicrobiae bacterium]|nr:DUF4838 domain-containing protein [Verrucomicrobiae bacterium]